MFGTQKSNIGDVDSRYNNLPNDQGDGFGYRGSFKFKKFNERYDLVIEPFFRIWQIKNSGTATTTFQGVADGLAIEPRNSTHEFGANLSLAF